MTHTIVHYGLHLIAPLGIALLFFPKVWLKAYIILLLTMIIDIDHLWATPVYHPCRCSIGFHFFHSYFAIAIYVLLLLFKQTRIIGVGLVFHVFTDLIDCFFMINSCDKNYIINPLTKQLYHFLF
jgi:hypothetical protein